MLRLQVSGLTSLATTATARIGVTVLADQHLALKIHRLAGSEKLEGSKTEAGVVFEARCVDSISAVCRASTGETQVVTSYCCQKGPSKINKDLNLKHSLQSTFLPIANQIISSGLEVMG